MAAGEFETSNWGWQWQQWQQQGGEWVELQLSKIAPVAPPHLSPGVNFSGWENLSLLLKFGGFILIAIALWQIAKWLERWWNEGGLKTAVESSGSATPKQPTAKDWLARSRQSQQQGDYRAACRCLYLAMLQQLNETRIVPARPSLTDGEYRQMLQQQPQRAACEVLLDAHETLYFGEREATPETVQRCQEAYREIDENSRGEGRV